MANVQNTEEEDLKRLEGIIAEAEKNASLCEGRIQAGMKQLKNDLGIPSLEEADKELGILETKMADLQKSLQDEIKSLKETYAW